MGVCGVIVLVVGGLLVTCSCSASSPLTSGWSPCTHSSKKPAAIKAANHSKQLHTNPQRLALPPTRWLWQADRRIHRRPRTPTLPLLMASCSRLMFKARGLACGLVISRPELWKHRLHFYGLLQDSGLLPPSHLIIATQKPQPPLGCEILFDGDPRGRALTAVLIQVYIPPYAVLLSGLPPAISHSYFSFKAFPQ